MVVTPLRLKQPHYPALCLGFIWWVQIIEGKNLTCCPGIAIGSVIVEIMVSKSVKYRIIIKDTYSGATTKYPKFCKEIIKFFMIFYLNLGHQLFHLINRFIIMPTFGAFALCEETLMSIRGGKSICWHCYMLPFGSCLITFFDWIFRRQAS